MSDLKHYGVKGMRWGVRKSRVDSARAAARQDKKDAAKPVHVERVIHVPVGTKKKKVSKMTEAELRARIERLELEKRVKDLESGKPAQQIKAGKSFTEKMIEKSGEILVTTMVTTVAGIVAQRMIKDKFTRTPLPPPAPGTRRG